MSKLKKKGLTMVELLAVIVIIGILASITIVTYTKYINSSKQEKYQQNQKMIENAAKMYLQNNQDERPKSIGESVVISIKTLKDKNYIKENIENEKKESCMDKSAVYVYKNSYQEYSYKGIIACGNEELDINSNIPVPVIENVKFSDTEDLRIASFSVTIKGDKDKTTEIDSYNYSFSVAQEDNEENYVEIYNSSNISGKKEKEIKIENALLKDYIDLTGNTYVKLNIIVRNSLGGVTETTTTTSFVDSEKPICGSIEGQAKNDNDWLNIKDIKENGKKRVIKVKCEDQNGSGCKRSVFTRTYGKEDNSSIEKSTITIEDNTGHKQTCDVDVNIDVVRPNAKIILRNKQGIKVLEKETNGEATLNINKDDYSNNHNGWLNGNEYNKVEFEVELSDDIKLAKYEWNTGDTIDSKKETISSPGNKITTKRIKIEFTKDGRREGTLIIQDQAKNSVTIVIKADVDLTKPNCDDSRKDETTTWTNQSRTIKWGCSDTTSKCSVNSQTGSQKFTTNTKTYVVSAYNIEDNAGNTKTCEERTANVYVDTTSPKCESAVECTSGKTCTNWLGKNDFVKISAYCHDDANSSIESGCENAAPYERKKIKSFEYKDKNYNTSKAGANGIGKNIVVKDKAGNTCTIKADKTVKIDIEAPSVPTVKTKDSSNKDYTGAWTNKEITATPSGSSDKGGSGFSHYEYSTSGSVGIENNKKPSTSNYSVSLKKYGISDIKYRACDKAGNCSNYSSAKTVKYDNISPNINCSIANNRISNVTIVDQFNSTNCTSSDKCSLFATASTRYMVKNNNSTPSISDSQWSNSIPSAQTKCGTTYYGFVKGADNAGNVTVKNCGSYTTATCCSPTNLDACKTAGYQYIACRNGNTCIYEDTYDANNELLFTYAGEIRSNYSTGVYDYIYEIPGENRSFTTSNGNRKVTWKRVYVTTARWYWNYNGNGKYVWIASNCLGHKGAVACREPQCPDPK